MMEKTLVTVDLNGFHFRKGNNFTRVPLGRTIEDNAYRPFWDAEELKLSYLTASNQEVSAEDVLPPPVEHEITFTQEEIDTAKATAFEPTIERLKELKRTELEKARDEMWTGELIVNLPGKGNVPFKTDVQTQMDVFLLTQELKTPGNCLGL